MAQLVRPSIKKDIHYIAKRLRKEDKRELKAAGTQSIVRLLKEGLHTSRPCLTLLTPDDIPCGLLGVVPVTFFYGRIWMLCTDKLPEYPIHVLKHSREWVNNLNLIYPIIGNAVDLRNEVHIKWLKWCGFTFLNKYQTCNNTVFQYFMKGGQHYVPATSNSRCANCS